MPTGYTNSSKFYRTDSQRKQIKFLFGSTNETELNETITLIERFKEKLSAAIAVIHSAF